MAIKDLLRIKAAFEKFCKAEKELIHKYPDAFCEEDFKNVKAIIKYIEEIR